MADRPYETRQVTAAIELREAEDAGPVLTGYASTFGQPYRVGFFRETIHRSAFDRTLGGNPDVVLLVDHAGQPLARTKSGTLSLSTDDHGLAVRASLDTSDPDVQRLLPKMRRGDMNQMSFGFNVPRGGDVWDYSGDVPERSIREASLSGGDVSIVTHPANEGTESQVRARDERESAFTLVESMLREVRGGHEFDEANIRRLFEALDSVGMNLRGFGVEGAELDALAAIVSDGDSKLSELNDALSGTVDESRVAETTSLTFALAQAEQLRRRRYVA